MDLINTLYKEYIESTDYVYYKEKNTIIIMKKLGDDMECISSTQPKKYHSGFLKVIVTFNLEDPYKLVHLTKYEMDETVSSYCYLSMEEAFNLHQTYYYNGQKQTECNYIDGKRNGSYQRWYMNGQKYEECNYIDGDKNGLYQSWHQNGQKYQEWNYINGKINGLCQRWYENGQKQTEYNYINAKMNGLYQSWYENGQKYQEWNYINGKINGLYQSWCIIGQKQTEYNYINGIKS